MRVWDKSGKQVGVQDDKTKKIFWFAGEIKNPIFSLDKPKVKVKKNGNTDIS